MKITDDKIKRFATRANRARPRGACPDEERLAAYLEGGLASEAEQELLSHLCRCSACLESVAVLRKVLCEHERECELRVPRFALDRARGLDPAGRSVIEIAIRFTRKAAEVLSLSGGASLGLIPAAEGLRSAAKVVSETLVTFSKEFPPFFAEIDVEKVRADRGEISIKVLEQAGKRPARGVRVSLFERDRELESAVVESGLAVFENVRFGRYRIEISKAGEPIGRVSLEMKGEGQ